MSAPAPPPHATDHRRRGPRGALVFLRPLEPADLPTVHAWYEDADFRRIMGDRPRSLAQRLRRYDEQVMEQGESFYAFAICRLDDGEMVGRMDMFEIDRVNGSAAFGIGIGVRDERGRGYGGDAVNALVDFSFGELRLERVWLVTDEDNLHAQATYRRCGFVEEARRRRAYIDRGRMLDEIRMSILRADWEGLPRKRSWDWLADDAAGERAEADAAGERAEADAAGERA